MTNAVVVGSGPNGLSAAVRLAQCGVKVRVLESSSRIGGGTRSSGLTLPGIIHDDCSAFHPTGVSSPFFRSLDLEGHGLTWLWPEIQLAHPLESGSAGVLWRDIEQTAEHMGQDGRAWLQIFGELSAKFDELAAEVFRPMLHVPGHPIALGRFGATAAKPASWTVRKWKRPETQALFGGVAAHAFTRLDVPLSSSVGTMLTAAAHAYGWPVAKGGSSAITNALANVLYSLGGTIETNSRVESLAELGSPDVVMLSVAPDQAAKICRGHLPRRVLRAFERYRYGPAAYKVDLVIDGEIPWINEECRRAGTVHLGGTFEETAEAERQVVRGRMPRRPFTLVGQQYLADPSRSVGNINPIWAYAHVPHNYQGRAEEAVIDRIDSFAPGIRKQILSVHVRTAPQMQQYNSNYVGGDISSGSNSGLQIAMRPRIAIDPYRVGIPGVYLCSSATPPGAGVHGMCGANAAQSALAYLGIEEANRES